MKEALEALGYEVFPIEGGWAAEKRQGGLVHQVFLSEKGEVRLRKRRFLSEESHPLALAGVEGMWSRVLESEENFFAVIQPQDLPALVQAFERLDPGGQGP
ncbi:MAG: hypothetical protein C4302_09260 [Thermus sp.]